jgi:hypothetical protein
MPRITGCTADGIEEACNTCMFKDDLEGCRLYHQVYGTQDIWSDD